MAPDEMESNELELRLSDLELERDLHQQPPEVTSHAHASRLLAINKQRTKALDVQRNIDKFSSNHNNRRIVLF